jgi:hypothetical protein
MGHAMTKPPPTAEDLSIVGSARFRLLPKPLTKVAVREIFDTVVSAPGMRPISQEIRVPADIGSSKAIYSFLCFETKSAPPFLASSKLVEVRYGFALLIERNGYLVIFQRGAKGLDQAVAKKSRAVDRRRLTHLHAANARYQKLTTRRMTIAELELRGVSYEARDLEIAFRPAAAKRAAVQTIRMQTAAHGNVGVTPSTGRIRTSAPRLMLEELVVFVDETIAAIETPSVSPFLAAFPEPMDLEQLPGDVKPAGILVNLSGLFDALDDPDRPSALLEAPDAPDVDELISTLSEVLTLNETDDGWDAVDAQDTVVARIKRLKNSYRVRFMFSDDYIIQDADGVEESFAKWLQSNASFSIAFTSHEYFYTDGKLYRLAGFSQEVAQVLGFLTAHPALDDASSEKGDPYPDGATTFAPRSIFRIVETTLSDDHYLWCGDLGDEWADYIGIAPRRFSFYHCKHGKTTTGASAFQIVIGQALKNLSRIKLRHDELREKLEAAEEREFWSGTKIPLLARDDNGGWAGIEKEMTSALATPTTTWRVVLVVSALSRQQFEKAAASPNPKPYFIQLVWLLSAFISECRERDAQPVIYCRP